MSARATLVLIAVLALLAAGYYALLRSEEKGREARQEARRVFEIEPETIASISVQQEDYAPVVGVRRADGTWHITAPYELDAYGKLWRRMAQHFADLEVERALSRETADLASYGLDYPRLTVSAQAGGGTLGPVVFGAADPTQTNRYARIGEGPIVLIGEERFFELNRSLEILRRHLLVDLGQAPLTAVEFAWLDKAEDGSLKETGVAKIEQQEDGHWQMVRPIEGPLGAESAGAFVGELTAARAQDFIDEPGDLSVYGLDPPRSRVIVWKGAGGESETIYFGKQAELEPEEEGKKSRRIYAKRADEAYVFTLPRSLAQMFPKHPDDWRDRRLITRPLVDLKKVHISNRLGEFTLVQGEEGGWHFEVPQPEVADQAAVANFLNAVTQLRVHRFTDDAPADALEPPRAEVTFTLGGDEPPVKIAIGSYVPLSTDVYARTDLGLVGRFSAETATLLFEANPLTFRRGRLLTFDEESLFAVEIQHKDRQYRFEKPGAAWRVEEPEDHVFAGSGIIHVLLDALDDMRSNRLVSSSLEDPAAYGLDNPILRVVMTEKREGGERVLPAVSVGKPDSVLLHMRFAHVEGRGEVVLVPERSLDSISNALMGVRPQ